MKKKSLLFFFAFLGLTSNLVCCSNSEPPVDSISEIVDSIQDVADSISKTADSLQGKDSTTDTVPEVRDIEGMILLSGGTVTLGSNDKDFKANEKPAMKVNLDYSFYMDGYELNSIASQGQKRMVLIAFKFALMRYIQYSIGITPIVLLDDILSELDKENKERLLNIIPENTQVIITNTDINNLDIKADYKLIELKEGYDV